MCVIIICYSRCGEPADAMVEENCDGDLLVG